MSRCKEKRTRKTKYANLISFLFSWDTFVQFSAEWEPVPPVCCRWSCWARTTERREQSEWGWSEATLHIPGKKTLRYDMIKNLSTEQKVHKEWLDLALDYTISQFPNRWKVWPLQKRGSVSSLPRRSGICAPAGPRSPPAPTAALWSRTQTRCRISKEY